MLRIMRRKSASKAIRPSLGIHRVLDDLEITIEHKSMAKTCLVS